MLWNRGRHNITFGGDFRRQQFNYFRSRTRAAPSPFTGAATGRNGAYGGSDFADFLLGIPDTSSIAFGNADKYFRESVYDAFFTDDWRMSSGLTLNAGVRWEYGAPITELYGRLVNLDIAPGLRRSRRWWPAIRSGPLTGPNAIRARWSSPTSTRFEPRLGIAWRPLSGSSHGGSRRIRRLLQHFGLSEHRAADGAAIAALEEPERAKQPGRSAHAGQRFQRSACHHAEHLRDRSEFPRRLRAELASYRCSAICPARCN